MNTNTPNQVHGIDWSGARKAGNSIWIASGLANNGVFHLKDLRRGKDLPHSSTERDKCYLALREWISEQGFSAIGFDFPFGLPLQFLGGERWFTFIDRFGDRFDSPETFRNWCRQQSPGSELKRRTDIEQRTPFSPYNLRMYRQTYWGIRSILSPLIVDDVCVALPMQKPRKGVPWLLETCPASTLKRLDLYYPYKGNSMENESNREFILEQLMAGSLTMDNKVDFSKCLISDPGGDALDSVIAAIAVVNALRRSDFPTLGGLAEYAKEAVVYT